MRKKKTKPVLPKCECCGIDLIPRTFLDPKRTLCTMDALRLGVRIDLSPTE